MRFARVFAFLSFVAAAAACGKGPAQAALAASDTAISNARAEGSKFVPDQFKSLSDAGAAARARFEAGDYKAALDQAQVIPAQAQTVMQQAVARKAELTESWKAFEGSLPPLLAAVQKRVMELMGLKKLPMGIDRTKLDAAKTALEGATAAWAEAGSAFGSKDLMAAVAKAGQVRANVTELMATLGMTSPGPEAAKK